MAERALVAKPVVDTATSKRSAASRVRAPGDDFEREAERVADGVMSGRGDAHPRRPLPRLLSTVNGSLAGQGRGIDTTTRTFMESRFGYDFGRVRVHTDERAVRSANAVRALAYTSGASIVFSANAYDPHSPAGRRLLAHELTHVVQQSNTVGLLHGIQRAPAPAPAGPWYQEAIDQVNLSKQRMSEQAKRNELVMAPPYYDVEKALLELCEAVDGKKNEDVPKKLDALLKAGLWVHLQILSRSLLTELTARMYEMGLESDAERLRKAFAAEDRFGPYNDDIYAARRKVDYLTRLVAGATADAKADSPDTIATSMHRFVRAYVAVRDEYLKIDMKLVETERGQRYGWMVMRPGMSHVEYYEAIRGQLDLWQRGLSTFEQSAMDAARRDLESPTPTGTGAALLKALRSAMVGELSAALFPQDTKLDISNEGFAITHTEMGKGKGSISDEFAKGKESRKLPINTYSPDQDWVRELRASLRQFYRVRIDQLNVLGRVYGVLDALEPAKDFADTMKNAEKASDNAATIRNMSGGRLRLDSDDDWRVFLVQKYNDLTNPPVAAPATPQTAGAPAPAPTPTKALTPAEALHDIIDLLFAYLKAFTVHARFTNIYDVGDTSYLNRPFPRALTGQAVHDCGVYALRVAYMLSLLRKELDLKFQFVILPVHVSLVITGGNVDVPSYIIENDQFTELSQKEFQDKLDAMRKYKDPTTDTAPAGKADDEQFVGELAAADFIRGPVDMPFRVTDVPPPVQDAKAEQRQLWADYQRVGTQDVFGPSSKKKDDPNYLFHLRYLELTEESRRIFNEVVVPFWNQAAPDAWDRLQAKLRAEPGKNAVGAPPRTTLTVADVLTPLREYRGDFGEALKPVKARYDKYAEDERRLSERLRADPNLAKVGVRLSVAARGNLLWHYYWDSHAVSINTYMTALDGRPKTDEEALEAVGKTLDPQWIPRDEKRKDPLD